MSVCLPLIRTGELTAAAAAVVIDRHCVIHDTAVVHSTACITLVDRRAVLTIPLYDVSPDCSLVGGLYDNDN